MCFPEVKDQVTESSIQTSQEPLLEPLISNRSFPKPVALKESALALFEVLLHQKFLTFELIRRRFAPLDGPMTKGKIPALYYRLYRMVKEGYLQTFKTRDHRLYALTAKGLKALEGRNPYHLTLPDTSEMATIEHDLGVSNVRFYLEASGASRWVGERLFRLKTGQIPRIPDGAFRVGDHVLFIEVEFSQKSLIRYREIFDVYTKREGATKVLYFYKNRSDVDPLIFLARQTPRFGFFRYSDHFPKPRFFIGHSAGRELLLEVFLDL